MKNKLYKIIYICGLLIHSQANVDNEINEMNNTIIPKEDIIIPETVINQKINIDIDLLFNSKKELIVLCGLIFLILLILSIKNGIFPILFSIIITTTIII